MSVRVFIACSLDGFIAGPGDDLSWLPPPSPDEDYGYREFMSGTSAIVMGRSTYEVAAGFEGPWPYGDTPVFVVTSRPLQPPASTVRAISGTPAEVLSAVRHEIEGGVYLDGGSLIRQFLEADLVDELTVTVVPVILGSGSPLFAGVDQRVSLTLTRSQAFDNGLVQLTYIPTEATA